MTRRTRAAWRVSAAVPLLAVAASLAASRADAGAAEATNDATAVVSLSLREAVARALESNESLRAAAAAVEAARAGADETRAGRLPSLGLSGRYARNFLLPSFFINMDGQFTKLEIGADNDFQGQAAATWNLWTAGRQSAAEAAARAATAAAAGGEAAAADLVRLGAREAYCGALLAASQVAIAEHSLRQSQETVRVTEAAFAEGTASRFDCLRAGVELSNRQPQLHAARNDLALALALLSRRCGLPPDVSLALTDSLAAVAAPAALDSLQALARVSSPRLKALAHAEAARRATVSLERAARGPVVQLSSAYAVEGQWSDGVTPPSENIAKSANVALGVQWPLFDGFRTRARTARAAADLRSAEAARQQAERDLDLAVREAWLTLANARARLEGRREAVALAQEAYRLAGVRLASGVATRLEALDAETALTVARAQLAAALYDCNVAQARLEFAIGGGAADSEGDSR